MTALERYARLEALGTWRECQGREPREVVVCFGQATLVLTDLSDRPLGHWALAGVQAVAHAPGTVTYAMAADGETLDIHDREMNAAIAAVARISPPAPRPCAHRWRRAFWPTLIAALAIAALLALLALPDAIRAQAARMIPPAQARAFGERMLLGLLDAYGPLCAEPEGERALARLGARIRPDTPLDLRVLDLRGTPVARLPGEIVLIDRSFLARAGAAEELAARITQALPRQPRPVERLVHNAGLLDAVRYIFTGTLGDPALARAAEAALVAQPRDAAVPAPGPARPTLSDQDRVALEGVCG